MVHMKATSSFSSSVCLYAMWLSISSLLNVMRLHAWHVYFNCSSCNVSVFVLSSRSDIVMSSIIRFSVKELFLVDCLISLDLEPSNPRICSVFLCFLRQLYFYKYNHMSGKDTHTSLVGPGALAHRLQRHTACNTSPPAYSNMADGVWKGVQS